MEVLKRFDKPAATYYQAHYLNVWRLFQSRQTCPGTSRRKAVPGS
jgi:hypothetical protein